MEISWNFVSLKKWEPCSYVCLFSGGPHVTITRDALDLTVQGPLGPPRT